MRESLGREPGSHGCESVPGRWGDDSVKGSGINRLQAPGFSACDQLAADYVKTDGAPTPLGFVSGPAAQEYAQMILSLRISSGDKP